MGRDSDLEYGREVIRAEIKALQQVLKRLDDGFSKAVELIFACRGRVVVTGIGKAGIVGQKISATLASTGTPSHSVHPVEAIHGDLGRILGEDVLLALSNSGETEVVQLLPSVKELGGKVISITGSSESTLARHSDAVVDIGKIREACPLGLAPSASTTAMLAVGDALALAVAKKRNLKAEQYALFHPGGELGRRLMPVDKVMRTGVHCPRVTAELTVLEALRVIDRTEGRAGAINVVDADGRLVGIFTDGDLRRRLQRDVSFLDEPIGEVMTASPKFVKEGTLASEAASVLRKHKIDELPVLDREKKLVGLIDVQDLLAVGIVRAEPEM